MQLSHSPYHSSNRLFLALTKSQILFRYFYFILLTRIYSLCWEKNELNP